MTWNVIRFLKRTTAIMTVALLATMFSLTLSNANASVMQQDMLDRLKLVQDRLEADLAQIELELSPLVAELERRAYEVSQQPEPQIIIELETENFELERLINRYEVGFLETESQYIELMAEFFELAENGLNESNPEAAFHFLKVEELIALIKAEIAGFWLDSSRVAQKLGIGKKKVFISHSCEPLVIRLDTGFVDSGFTQPGNTGDEDANWQIKRQDFNPLNSFGPVSIVSSTAWYNASSEGVEWIGLDDADPGDWVFQRQFDLGDNCYSRAELEFAHTEDNNLSINGFTFRFRNTNFNDPIVPACNPANSCFNAWHDENTGINKITIPSSDFSNYFAFNNSNNFFRVRVTNNGGPTGLALKGTLTFLP